MLMLNPSRYLLHAILLGVSIFQLCSSANVLKEIRKFTTEINPGCQEEAYPLSNCSSFRNISLIHIRSDGKSDSFHFLWSFIGAPTLLMARTPLETNLTINWIDMIVSTVNPSIAFEPKPYYSFGWSLVKVWVADDTNDKVKLDQIDQSNITGYASNNFKWERKDDLSFANETDIRFTFISKAYKDGESEGERSLGPNGFLKITIRMKSSADYSDVLPYMLYTESGTQVDIAFNDVQLNTTEAEYPKNPRIGFKYILVQDEYLKNSTSERMRIEKKKTLDDEHTPGVFEMYSLRTPVLHGKDQSYIQWKPICYTGEVRDVIDSVDVWSYSLLNASSVNGNDNIQDSILYSYYGSEVDSLLLKAMNISFGTQGDGFYNKTKHISWTYSTGFGDPPADHISMLVILIVAVGLGIPFFIIIISIVYVIIKRVRQPRDDLLLGR